MENENISPALYETPPSQMTSQEFQRMLYTWFEEKGLVADLRSYLRVLMINKLRNTTVGKIDHNKTNFSLPKQAFSLVIAEHLLREGCHYTLSIFSTEVPGVANQLPFSLFEAHCQKESDTWRFDQDSVLNVLELVGISKNSNESLRIAALYFRNYGSLLSCMISSKTADGARDSKIDSKNNEDIGDYLNRVLSVMGVPTNIIDEVGKRLQQNITQERERNTSLIQGHFGKIIEELKMQLEAKDNHIKQLVDEHVVQKKDNKKLRSDLKDTRKRLNQMILQEKSVKMKEEQIREQLEELGKLQQGLKESFHKDKEKILEPCAQKHCTQSCQNNLLLREELQKEILQMQETDKNKTVEIERLNAKVNSLLRSLQNSQIKIEFLNSCLLRSNQINMDQGEEPRVLSDETSESLTEEVLKEVRSKLLELERESDELD
ncbi:MLP1-like, partial [Asbolus verrucosus]